MAKQVLIVEDEPMLRDLIGEEFQDAGFIVTKAADGIEGQKHFEQSGPFDFVICDISMPRMRGDELQRWASVECAEKRKTSKWMALTAYMPGDVADFKEEEFDVVFYKPISFKLVLNWVHSQKN